MSVDERKASDDYEKKRSMERKQLLLQKIRREYEQIRVIKDGKRRRPFSPNK